MGAGSTALRTGFVALAVLLAILFGVGVYAAWLRTGAGHERARRTALLAAVGMVVWLGVTLGAAAAGKLRFDTTPPTMLLVLAGVFALALAVGLSQVGARLAAGIPLAILVGVQGFRLPLELMMHRAYAEGIMPVQMSYSGYNFDIVTGATALIVAALLAKGVAGTRLVRVWNWLGIALLANILVIALLSAPMPFRRFMNEPPNVWITQPPYVWLPAAMVLTAVLGHILVIRRLRLERAPGAAHSENAGLAR